MRLADIKNFLRRAGFDHFFQHLAAVKLAVFDLAVELAIAKSARAAFAELHIALGLQNTFAPQAPGVLGAFAHRLATLKHDGPKTRLRQDQCCKQAARAGANNHGALL